MEHGVGDLTLRQLAEGVNTTHRSLLYYFGSWDGLLVEVVREVERREQRFLDEEFLREHADESPVEQLRAVWAYCTDPAFGNYLRLFFELYGQALQGRTHTERFLGGIVEAWLEPFSRIFRTAGRKPAQARLDARLTLAVLRGLFLDLLATGDLKATTRAFEQFLGAFAEQLGG
jgi:AcrR family transcriptional regulator